MAFPFNKMPTLGEYLRWAESQGFEVQSGVTNEAAGRPHAINKVRVPETDRHMIFVGMRESERLAPSQIRNADRRLGVDSGFASMSEPDEG